MDKLVFLGTGAAMNMHCATTAIALQNDNSTFLIDTAGGHEILTQLTAANIDPRSITQVFITHSHTDHILGIPWLMRLSGHGADRDPSWPPLTILAPPSVLAALHKIVSPVLPRPVLRKIGDHIRLQPLEDGDSYTIGDRRITFFDIGANKTTQFGLYTPLADGSGLTYLGDEPMRDAALPYVKKSAHVIHEAFCTEASLTGAFDPRSISHSTVRDAAQNAVQAGASHLILFHSAEACGTARKESYQEEAATIFTGRISVPDDLETVMLTQ